MAREDLIYGNLGGYGEQSGEYGLPYALRSMNVYTGRRRLAETPDEIEARLIAESQAEEAAQEREAQAFEDQLLAGLPDLEFQEAEDALTPRGPSARPELAMLAARQAQPVAAPAAIVAPPRPQTRADIMAEQRRLGVPADGVVGPVTLAARQRAARSAAPELPANPEVEAGLARARQVLMSSPDGATTRGGPVVMPEMRVTAARPQLTPEQEQVEAGLARARQVLMSAPDGGPVARRAGPQVSAGRVAVLQPGEASPWEAMMRRRRDAEYQRVVEGAEAANARQTADMRAQELGAALNAAGQDFLGRLSRGQVDASQYTPADRQAKPVAFDARQAADARARELSAALGVTDAQMSRKLDASMVQPYTFEYGAGAGPAGRRAGVMAQDLERSGPLGAATVRETPRGKVVDVGQLGGLNAAQIGRLNERVKKLEEK